MRPDRTVIRCDADVSALSAKKPIEQIYASVNGKHQSPLFMDVHSVEFREYGANTMLSTRISYIEELANLANCVGTGIASVRRGIGSNPRLGYAFLYPRCGYRGFTAFRMTYRRRRIQPAGTVWT